jgi:hypothetical protein
LGQQAILLAGRVDALFDTGNSVAALSKELRVVMAKALDDVQVGADPLDQLRARRLSKLGRIDQGDRMDGVEATLGVDIGGVPLALRLLPNTARQPRGTSQPQL